MRVESGRRFDMLTVVIEHDRLRVECLCDCGKTTFVRRKNLLSGNSGSCGCRKGRSLHGYADIGMHNAWMQMISRCNDPRNHKFAWYGARGIKVCERWLTFSNFLSDMGERPTNMTLDRIDVDGNYEPGNCRWASSATQRRNRSDVKLEGHEPKQIRWLLALGYRGREIAAFFGVGQHVVSKIKLGKIYKDLTL